MKSAKKVTLYAIADKRPDFIPLQVESFKKFITDEYEFVILNNAIDSPQRKAEISQMCQKFNITCWDIVEDPRYVMIGKQLAINNGAYTNANVACAYPLKWAWDKICTHSKDSIIVVIDSDMFLTRSISFNQELDGCDASFMIQYRGLFSHRLSAEVSYIWNGICIFDASHMKDIEDINWDCGVIKKAYIKGHAVDVGGYTHSWLKEHTQLKVRHISEYAIRDFQVKDSETIKLECTLNGNYHYFFEYDRTNHKVSNFECREREWAPHDSVLPHMPADFQETVVRKSIKYFERFILDQKNCPMPITLGFIEFETYQEDIDPWIIHHKAGSGYLGFDADYSARKLAFIKETLSRPL